MKPKTLTEIAIGIIEKRGNFALVEASQQILQSTYDDGMISEALKYYAKTVFPRVLPIFPALIDLSCEVVGGKTEEAKFLAVPMLLITASGDIHDDIIDKSTKKYDRKTVFGKYGQEITLLAGDVLLTQGLSLFQKSSEFLSAEQRANVLSLITEAMVELTAAEASEICLWKKRNLTPEECFEVIEHKGSVAELHCRIGGIIGSADEKNLVDLKEYGKLVGILSTMKDEFLDLENFSELKNRINNEMPPYPIVCAFQNKTLRKQILPIIMNQSFSEKDLPFVVESILSSDEVKKLKSELKELVEKEISRNKLFKDCKNGEDAYLLLKALTYEM
jgi:geranylgeranyl pyrophosphate synthase